jgi:hypothetical protein
MLAVDKFFPTLIERFIEEIEVVKDFKAEDFLKLSEINQTIIKKEWAELNIPNTIFNLWSKLTPEKKADILVKWMNNGEKVNQNYIWRIQGLLSKLGRLYEANPKLIPQIETNGFKLELDFTYEDVMDLYYKLPDKLKLILKIMIYTGLNGADIVLLKPSDFNKYVDKKTKNIYYYVMKKRLKTAKKDAYYVILFSASFVEELKEYFQRKIIKHIKKPNKKIKRYRDDRHFNIQVIGDKEQEAGSFIVFEGSYDWNKDKDNVLFSTKSSLISEGFKYHINKHNLNTSINSAGIRSMCFTRLKKIFSMDERDLYHIWTQHKVGIISKDYITDNLPKLVEKLEQIEEQVLIESGVTLIKKIKDNSILKNELEELKEKVNKIETFFKDFKNWKDGKLYLIEKQKEEDKKKGIVREQLKNTDFKEV